MADPITLARPYAKAAFEASLEAEALGEWSRMLGVAAAVAGQPAVHAALTDPGMSRQQAAAMFSGLCEGELNEQVRNLIGLLAENRRLLLLPQICALFEELKADRERSVDVEFVTAFPISEDASGNLEQALKTRLQRDIRLTVSVDPTLIGGAVIRAGDQVMDSSIRGKLAKLAETMKT